jgi:hypothetical protein
VLKSSSTPELQDHAPDLLASTRWAKQKRTGGGVSHHPELWNPSAGISSQAPTGSAQGHVGGLARDLPETVLRATSRRPTTRPSAAPLTCAVVWVHEVPHGVVNHPRIDGKDGVAGSIPVGCSTPEPQVTPSLYPPSCMVCRTRGARARPMGHPPQPQGRARADYVSETSILRRARPAVSGASASAPQPALVRGELQYLATRPRCCLRAVLGRHRRRRPRRLPAASTLPARHTRLSNRGPVRLEAAA